MNEPQTQPAPSHRSHATPSPSGSGQDDGGAAAGRPVIGIITNLGPAAEYMFPGYERVTLNGDYPRSVAAAGGVPVLLSPSADLSLLPGQLSVLDGLVLAGGPDVSPLSYGQEPLEKCGPLSPVRDAYELEALRLARRSGTPVFAICRGMQLANVFFGGTLFQDLSYAGLAQQHWFQGNPAAGVHTIDIEPGTFLHQANGGQTAVVNSYHHQVVDRLGEGLRVCARSRDGAVEALEHTGPDWDLTGVEWHPEMMSREDPLAQRLFAGFVDRLRQRS